MHYYTGLLKKEWAFSKKALYQNTMVILIVWITSMGASYYWNEPYVVLSVGVLLITVHLFYMAVDMAISLSKEAKLKQWLHNPNPAFSLLSSKMVISIATCLFSLLFTFVLTLLASVMFQAGLEMGGDSWGILLFIGEVMAIGVYLGVWSIFLWTLIMYVKRFKFGTVWQVLVGLALWPIFSFHQAFVSSSLYAFLKSVGTIPFVTVGTAFEEDAVTFGTKMGEFSISLVAVFTFVSILLLWVSTLILDEKIEL